MTKEQKEKLAKYRRTKEYMVSDPALIEYERLLELEKQEELTKSHAKIDQRYWT